MACLRCHIKACGRAVSVICWPTAWWQYTLMAKRSAVQKPFHIGGSDSLQWVAVRVMKTRHPNRSIEILHFPWVLQAVMLLLLQNPDCLRNLRRASPPDATVSLPCAWGSGGSSLSMSRKSYGTLIASTVWRLRVSYDRDLATLSHFPKKKTRVCWPT